MVGEMVSRSIEFHSGLASEITRCGVLAAIRRIERTNPFADFVVLQRRDSFEISAHNRREMHGSGVIADFGDGRRQMHHGIVFQRDRRVAGRFRVRSPSRSWKLFRWLARRRIALCRFSRHTLPPSLSANPAANLVPIFGDQNSDAGVAAGLLHPPVARKITSRFSRALARFSAMNAARFAASIPLSSIAPRP